MTETGKLIILSSDELVLLGREDVAYVKTVATESGANYAVHAADGTELAICADRDVAFALLRQHDLEPVSVH